MNDTFTLILSRADVATLSHAMYAWYSEVPGVHEREMDLARMLSAILEDGATSPVTHNLASQQ